jgi:xanthine dehydrogenase small subunit
MPPVLIALGAKLDLRTGGIRRTISIEEYFLKYKVTTLKKSEFIEKIIIPRPDPLADFKVYKISKRLEDDISATCGAFNIQIEQGAVSAVKIAFGGMAEIPKRAKHCEQALLNQPWNSQSIERAMVELKKDFTPISDFRASADYRLEVSKNMLRRLYLELESDCQTIRVTQHA